MANVMLTWYATPDEVARVRRGLPKGSVVLAPRQTRSTMLRFTAHRDDLAAAAPKADAMMGWIMPPDLWGAAKNLKAVAWLHAGCDELDFPMLKRRGIKVANIRGGNGIAVAEHAMALMLGLGKRLVERHRWVEEAHWQPTWHPDYSATLLEGKTVAVVGYGMIGTAVGRRSKAFDMKVIGIRRNPKKGGRYADEIHGPGRLHAVLKRADFVVLATPITKETVGFFDEATFAAMKPRSFLINIARGNLIVEQALHQALTRGQLRGYAADVWWTYENTFPPSYHFPIVSRTGLHKLPNVICTGDQAANVDGITGLEIDMGTESLAAFFRGKRIPREVDLDLGY